YNRAFRTYVVLVWMFTNAALVAIVLNAGGLQRLNVASSSTVAKVATNDSEESGTVKVYLFVVLWSVAALSGFKFIGAMWYKIHRIVSSPNSKERISLTVYAVQEIISFRGS